MNILVIKHNQPNLVGVSVISYVNMAVTFWIGHFPNPIPTQPNNPVGIGFGKTKYQSK